MELSPLNADELARVKQLPWRLWDDAGLHRVPPRLASWLAESGSLTQKLRDQGLRVSVRRLSEGMTEVDEWQRQVLLLAGDTPWLWGFTQISTASLAACHELTMQGDRPIGDWLFGLGGARRLSLEWIAVPTASARLFEQLAGGAPSLWGRRARLKLNALCQKGSAPELVLTELFLPGAALPPCFAQEESVIC